MAKSNQYDNEDTVKQKTLQYAARLGDDSLILGHRLSEWTSNGPFLEEDIAMGNVALDYVGRARMFYTYAAELAGNGKTEDDFAYLRDERQFQNYLLLELPRGDFAFTIVRQLFVDVYNDYFEELSQSCQDNVKENGTVFDFDSLIYTLTPEASKDINNIETNAIIIAGSGMCNGGRITHHFKHRIWNEKNSIIFVGYQAVGTLGREIVEGAEWINLYGEDIIVKASIHTINGFSAHGDQSKILDWMLGIEKLKNIFIVHGEKEAQEIFKEQIKEKLNIDAHIVKYGEKITL